jgi:CheY-like chemotaxis protein
MTETSSSGIIRSTRFLVVDGDKNALGSIQQFLESAGAPHITVAAAPIVALRVLQEPRSRIDCVICAHKKGTITGLQFLQSLRSGRWGVGKIRDVKFILMMNRLDVPAVQAADNAGVSGYFIGDLQREAFLTEIAKALTETGTESPLPKMQIAHINMSGVDMIFVPTDASFAQAGSAQQQNVVNALQAYMQEHLLAGAVTPVWQTEDSGLGYFASPQYHAMLASLTMDFVRSNLNRELTALRPPPYVSLSSKGGRAYAEWLASEAGDSDGALLLKGYEAPAEPAASGAGAARQKSAGVSGGPPPRQSADFGGPRVASPSRGVHGGPGTPECTERPDFSGPKR